jgi:hypothetical protein
MNVRAMKQWTLGRPVLLGVGISGALLCGLLLQEVLMDRFTMILGPESARDEFGNLRIAVVHCLLAGYVPGAYYTLLRGARNTIDRLEANLRPAGDTSSASLGGRLGKRGLIISGLLGTLFTVFTPFLTTPEPPWNPSTWQPEVWWHRALGLFIGWWAGWLTAAVWNTSARTSRLATRVVTVDLLDLRQWSPFVRQGLLTALLIVGLVSILSLMLLDPTEWPVIAVAVGLCLPLALLGLWLPVRGAHRRIRQVKEAELEWIREQIRPARDRLQDATAQGKMADLIAYLRLIEDAPEWPFQTSTFVQMVLYLLIPVASWVGGLLIEGLLGQLLG